MFATTGLGGRGGASTLRENFLYLIGYACQHLFFSTHKMDFRNGHACRDDRKGMA
jgi:hypothetical protein